MFTDCSGTNAFWKTPSWQALDIVMERRIADSANTKEQRDNDRSITEVKQLIDDLRAEKEFNVSREIDKISIGADKKQRY